jgi:hypothetical protein
MRERDLYPSVKRWLTQQGCFASDVDSGVRAARIDGIGLKDVGGELSSRAELIAVEVKWGKTPFGNALGQAHGYSIYADRCYLADLRSGRAPFTPQEVRMASHLGVGLLAVSQDSRGRFTVREVLTAPLGQPLDEMRLLVVEKLGYSECTICQSPFRRGDAEAFARHVSRATSARAMQRAVSNAKGFMYWLNEASERAGETRAQIFHRRYVCPDCVRSLFGDAE